MLSLDGFPVLMDEPNRLVVEDFIRKYVPTDSYLPWLRRGWPGGGLAMVTYPEAYRPEPAFRLNRFRWPVFCSRWAFGHFAMDSDSVGQIQADSCIDGGYNTVELTFGSPELPSGEMATLNVFVLPPTPLSGRRGLSFDNTGSTSLYLLTVVDQRYFLWSQNVGDLKITSSTDWDSLYTTVSDAMGIELDWDDIPSQYLKPSTMFNLPWEPAPIILDAISFNVGQRIVANFDGTFKAMDYETALSLYMQDQTNHPQRLILSGGIRFADPL